MQVIAIIVLYSRNITCMVHMHADGSPLVAFFMKRNLAILMRNKNPQEMMSFVAEVLQPLIATEPITFAAIVEHSLMHGASDDLQREGFRKEVTQQVAAVQVCL